MNDSISLTDTEIHNSTTVIDDSLASGVEGVVRTHHVGYSSWISVNIIILALLLFVIVYRERQYIAGRMREFFSPDTRFIFSRPNPGAYKMHVSIVLILVACSSIGLMASALASQNPMLFTSDWGDTSRLGFAMKVMWYSLLFFLLKSMAYAVINWVFFKSDENQRWLASYLFITASTAFILFPSALIQLFVGLPMKIVSFCSVFLFILYEISVFYKLLVNFKTNKYGYVLIFLYLCTVELLPSIWVLHNVC